MILFKSQAISYVIGIFLLCPFLVGAQSDQSNNQASHFTFPEEEEVVISQEKLDRISRLSELYIQSSITPTELAELKSYDADFGVLDAYKVTYQKRIAGDIRETGEGEATNPHNQAVARELTNEIYPAPLTWQTKLIGTLQALTLLSFPLAALSTVLVLVMLLRNRKRAEFLHE